MNTKLLKNLTLIVLIVLFAQACAPFAPLVQQPVLVENPVVVEPLPAVVEAPELTFEQPAPAQPAVIELVLPFEASAKAKDQVSSAVQEAFGGDRFTFEQLERPFNPGAMAIYYPGVDIVTATVYQDNTWIFGGVQVFDQVSDSASTHRYAMELDTDLDGRGDWLVLAVNPTSTEWSAEGVQIFADANDNIGGETVKFADQDAAGDGYEALLASEDFEVAVARISPSDPNQIQIAVKRSIVNEPRSYFVSLWAGGDLLDPALFDLNDHFTHEQAGAAVRGFEFFYPIKAVYEIDNTCSMAVGVTPTGYEPGSCSTPEQPHVNIHEAPTQNTCPPCNIGATSQDPYPSCMCYYPPIP